MTKAFNAVIKDAKRIEEECKSKLELKARTPLGERLLSLREKIIASGEPLLSWEDIDMEVKKRRKETD